MFKNIAILFNILIIYLLRFSTLTKYNIYQILLIIFLIISKKFKVLVSKLLYIESKIMIIRI